MRKIVFFVVAASVADALGGAAFARPYYVTPSGKPDAVFSAMTAEQAQGKIASYCMDHAMSVSSNSPGQVTCELKMGMMQSALSQALIGNSYSTTPREFVRFSVVAIGPDARAQGNAWVETQMAFGQMRQQVIDGDAMNNSIENVLLASGGKLPSGTQMLPGVAWLGFETGAIVQRVDDRKRHSVFSVKSVDDGSPVHKAGLKAGDVVTKVDGQYAKDQDDMINKLADVRRSGRATFPIIVERGGAMQVLTVESMERPVVGVGVAGPATTIVPTSAKAAGVEP